MTLLRDCLWLALGLCFIAAFWFALGYAMIHWL